MAVNPNLRFFLLIASQTSPYIGTEVIESGGVEIAVNSKASWASA